MKGVCGGGQQQQSLTPVVGIVILLAITVILVTVVSGVFLGVSDQLREPAPTFTSERGVAVSTNGTDVSNTLVLEHRGGEPVDATGLSVVVNTKSESRRVPVPLSGDLADGRWTADEQLRLPLNQTDVCAPGSQVEFVLTQETDSEYGYVLREFTVPIARDQFAIRNGAVVPTTGYEADVEVIGAALTYGPHGPDIPVGVQVHLGSQTHDPWPADINDGANPRSYTTGPQAAQTDISVTATASAYGGYGGRSVDSTQRSTWVQVLRDGDPAPTHGGYGSQQPAAGFVAPYIQNGTITLARNQAIFLFELGASSPTSSAADYQDAVVLVSMRAQQGGPQTGPDANQSSIVCTGS